MRKGKDPNPYLWLMDPDPGGPKHADPDPQHWYLAIPHRNAKLSWSDLEKLTIFSPLLDTRAWVEPRLILWILDAACSASALAQMTSNSPNSPRGLTVRLQGGLPFNLSSSPFPFQLSCSSLNFLFPLFTSLNFLFFTFFSFFLSHPSYFPASSLTFIFPASPINPLISCLPFFHF